MGFSSSTSIKGKWNISKSKLVLLCLLINIFICCMHEQQALFVKADRIIAFQQYGVPYKASGYEIATYFLTTINNKFFRGYFELYFDRMTELQGVYTFIHEPTCPFINTLPQVVSQEGLSAEFCFTWDTSALTKGYGKDESIILKIYPQIALNVDPYSVRIFSYSAIKGEWGGYTFTPLSPTDVSKSPQLGPWELKFQTEDEYLGKQLNFIIFAKSKVDAQFNSPVAINYPRQVDYPNQNGAQLSLLYENATIIDSKVHQLPTVTVTEDASQVDILENYKKVAQYMIEEDNLDRYGLDETRVFYMSHGLQVDDSFIDPTSIKCAYAFSDSNFKTLSYDPTITVVEAHEYLMYYKIACKQYISQSKYLLTIVGKKYKWRRGYPDSSIGFWPGEVAIIPWGPELYVSIHPQSTLDGWYSIITEGLESYLNTPICKTLQEPLELSWIFKLDYANAKMGENAPNVNVLKMSFLSYMPMSDVDPFSLRVFEYSESKEMFLLVQEDVPTVWRSNFEFDIGSALIKNPTITSKIFAVALYKSVKEKIGNVVYVNYNRKVQFQQTPGVQLEMSFTYLSSENFLYSKRPYFTLAQYSLSPEVERDWTVLYGVMQQNGNGLDIYNIDERRVFTVSYDFVKLDESGNQVPIKFDDLKCAYLFKDSHFKNVEVGKPTLTFNDERREVTITCDEDIRDESFVFMLTTPKFYPTIISQMFDNDFGMSPVVQGHYSMFQYGLNDDALTISFNPSGRSSGIYRISRDLKSYDSYSIPKSEYGPLQIIACFTIDFNKMNLFSSAIMDNQAFLRYDKNTEPQNLDPFSYRFFLIDDTKRSFEWWNCKDQPSNKPWYASLMMDTDKIVKFAILADWNSIGVPGTFYSIHYDRDLTYSTGVDQKMIFYFSSKSFPEIERKTRFVLQLNNYPSPILTPDYTIVKAGTIVQNLNKNIDIQRVFTYTNNLKDLNGYSITDLLSLQCVYTFSGTTVFGKSSVTNDSSVYSLTCSDFVESDMYDWVIVAKSNYKPPVVTTSNRHNIQPNDNNNQQGSIVFLSLLVTLLFIIVFVLTGLVIYFAYSKKQIVKHYQGEEKLFNLDDMKHYHSTINNTL